MGTNALEEAAYLLDLTLSVDMPIIMTGTMRNPSLLSPDGPIKR